MTRFVRIQELAGGKWFLDLRALAFAVPFAITTSVLVGGPRITEDTFAADRAWMYLAMFLANCIAIGACALLCILANKSIFRTKHWAPQPLVITITVGAVLGGLKGFLTGYVIAVLGLEPLSNESLATRSIQAAVLGAWLIPTVAYVAGRLEQYALEREALVGERVKLSIASQPGLREDQINEIREFAAAARRQLNSSGLELAETIRAVVDRSLRPISHKLWDLESNRISSFNIRELLGISLRQHPLPALWSATAFSLSSISAQLRVTSPIDALLRALVIWLLIATAFALLSPLIQKFNGWHLIAVMACTFTVSYFSYEVTRTIFGMLPGYPIVETVLGSWVWLFELTIVGSIYFGVRATRDDIRNQLAATFDADSLNRAAEMARANLQTRQFANYLHGQVQNKLLAIALRIESGGITDDKLAIDEADSVIRSLESELSQQTPKSIEEELVRISEQWRGFAVVTFEIKAAAGSITSPMAETLSQVFEEAVANAVRHGHARSIQLECHIFDNHVQVIVNDDGLGPRRGKKGLGSRYFDAISESSWSLTERPSGGTRLELKVDLLRTR